MFDNQKYITQGIKSTIPDGMIAILFGLIDRLKTKMELDYLQVFNISSKLEDGLCKYVIMHSQEIPKYNEVFEVVALDDAVIDDCKVFVIDDITHSTMLLAEEY
ncbi:MAG: DUF960 domain-containing protein [Anaeroplasma sp.]|nr:DUF960 domain-containing protein [Anaeroplasma sp.]